MERNGNVVLAVIKGDCRNRRNMMVTTVKMGGLKLSKTKEGLFVDQYKREWKQIQASDRWELKYVGFRQSNSSRGRRYK